jgi:hypothetical protein
MVKTIQLFTDENGKLSSTRAMAAVALLLFVGAVSVGLYTSTLHLELYRIISGLVLGLAGITGVRGVAKNVRG